MPMIPLAGRIVRLTPERGFLVCDASGIEYSFVRGVVEGNFEALRVGQPVRFEQANALTPCARRVIVAERAP